MRVDVPEEDALDQLLCAHRWHPREHGAGLRELSIGDQIPEALYEAVAEILREAWEQDAGPPAV